MTVDHNNDSVTYTIEGNRVTQVYKSLYFDNSNTTIAIPVQLCPMLNELVYQLNELDKASTAQHMLGNIFHAWFDISTCEIETFPKDKTIIDYDDDQQTPTSY